MVLEPFNTEKLDNLCELRTCWSLKDLQLAVEEVARMSTYSSLIALFL